MDPAAIPTPPLSSTTAPESCISTQAPPAALLQLLEISLISAQDLAPISKSMQTHAVAWITPTRKHTTRTDQKGHRNPTWNDKFIFALDNNSENAAALSVEIYTASWFRDVLVGAVKVPLSDLINPLTRAGNTRFVALQVLRASGNPQGTLNMGVALLESTMRSMPLSIFPPAPKNIINIQKQVDDEDINNNKELNAKIHLWRSLSTGSSVLTNNEDFPIKQGSICNGSEICSDIGPSASIVAVELAKKQQSSDNSNPSHDEVDHHGEAGSSILEELTIEEAKAKGYKRVVSRERWRKVATQCDKYDNSDESELLWDNNGRRRSSRRSSDGGLFSCLVYGIEFTIVCGTSKNARSSKSSSSSTNSSVSKKKKNSEASSA